MSENFSINELVDNSLSKNYQKTSEIISESNYKLEDGIIILRTFLQRAKRLLNIYEKQENNVNFDSLINDYKPPIFWKDKPVLKKQLKVWNLSKLEIAKKKVFDTELLIKTKLTNLSDILIKKLLVDLCNLGNSNL